MRAGAGRRLDGAVAECLPRRAWHSAPLEGCANNPVFPGAPVGASSNQGGPVLVTERGSW